MFYLFCEKENLKCLDWLCITDLSIAKKGTRLENRETQRNSVLAELLQIGLGCIVWLTNVAKLLSCMDFYPARVLTSGRNII